MLARFAIEPTAGALVLAQLYGSALFGLAITSWMARTMLLGGIYGRSIVVGGFAHALVGMLALFHALRASPAMRSLGCVPGVRRARDLVRRGP